MRKLSELKISPTPWKFTDNLIGTKKQFNRGDGLMFAWLDSLHLEADARLIAAAPDMYQALYDECFDERNTVNCSRCGGNDHAGVEYCSKTCPFYKARAALAKASGESEVAE